jgi:hypothetical protein
MYWVMNKKPKLSVENNINHIQSNTSASLDIRRQVMGMQQTIQHKNTPNLAMKNSQDHSRFPLDRLKSNIPQ